MVLSAEATRSGVCSTGLHRCRSLPESSIGQRRCPRAGLSCVREQQGSRWRGSKRPAPWRQRHQPAARGLVSARCVGRTPPGGPVRGVAEVPPRPVSCRGPCGSHVAGVCPRKAPVLELVLSVGTRAPPAGPQGSPLTPAPWSSGACGWFWQEEVVKDRPGCPALPPAL